MKVTEQTIIGDVLDFDMETAAIFFAHGMGCVGCPHSRGESIAEACVVHGIEAAPLVEALNEYFASKK